MAKNTKRSDALAKLIDACVVNPDIETCGPVRDYLGSVTEFDWQDARWRLTFHPNNHTPRCEVERLYELKDRH